LVELFRRRAAALPGRYETLVLAHADAAYNLARRLTGDPAAAEDVVQEAFMNAARRLDDLHGEARPWILAIVRNGAIDWLRRHRPATLRSLEEADLVVADPNDNPEAALIRAHEGAAVRRLIDALPLAQREVLVLREIEDLSYRQIAEVVGAPMGTVMSRLARARSALAIAWNAAESAR
jgi:RNA polymerase sigma-70 factor (ECF subfamily)